MKNLFSEDEPRDFYISEDEPRDYFDRWERFILYAAEHCCAWLLLAFMIVTSIWIGWWALLAVPVFWLGGLGVKMYDGVKDVRREAIQYRKDNP